MKHLGEPSASALNQDSTWTVKMTENAVSWSMGLRILKYP